jgi:plastocyanin
VTVIAGHYNDLEVGEAMRSRSRAAGGETLRIRAAAGAVALFALLLGGCGGDGNDDKTSTASAQQEAVPAVVKVSIGDNFYKPKDLTIKRGQSISWRNQGAVPHTVTSESDSAVKFDSGTVEPGGVYALKPNTAGKITYYCTVHGKVQSGTVTVERG